MYMLNSSALAFLGGLLATHVKQILKSERIRNETQKHKQQTTQIIELLLLFDHKELKLFLAHTRKV